MGTIRAWTKQHESVWKKIQKDGRYAAKLKYVNMDLEECADVVLEAYEWLIRHHPKADERPADAETPVWVSLDRDATMLPSAGTVILELELDEDLITPLNITKWGMIMNYSYIPASDEDGERHRREMNEKGISDVKAYSTPFYPLEKREIVSSWSRLFDRNILIDRDGKEYGLIWEIRKEWVKQVLQ